MRDLRPDGLSDDGRSMLLSDDSTETARAESAERFRVAVDERFRSVLRGRPTSTSETRVESALPPREIQARLRAGSTVEDVARAAGIPVARVQRYEVPIAAERARVVSEAREATVPPADRTHPGRPLGQLVDARLVRDGIDPAAVTWEARRQSDGSWFVRLPLGDRGSAEFSWDASARRIRPVDALAQELLQPAPVPQDESIEAVAEATGVTSGVLDDVPLAVGAENGRRPSGRSSGRPTGLVVLAGARGDDREGAGAAPPPREADAGAGTVQESPQPAGVPGAEWVAAAAAGDRSTGTIDTETIDEARTVPGGGRGPANEVPADTDVQRDALSAQASPAAPQPGAPSATASVAGDALFATADSGPAAGPAPGRGPRARAGGRRGQVPAWDDIVFGAKRS